MDECCNDVLFSIIRLLIHDLPTLRLVCHRWRQLIDNSRFLQKRFALIQLTNEKRLHIVVNKLPIFSKLNVLFDGFTMSIKCICKLIKTGNIGLVVEYLKKKSFVRVSYPKLLHPDGFGETHKIVYTVFFWTSDQDFETGCSIMHRFFYNFHSPQSFLLNITEDFDHFLKSKYVRNMDTKVLFQVASRLQENNYLIEDPAWGYNDTLHCKFDCILYERDPQLFRNYLDKFHFNDPFSLDELKSPTSEQEMMIEFLLNNAIEHHNIEIVKMLHQNNLLKMCNLQSLQTAFYKCCFYNFEEALHIVGSFLETVDFVEGHLKKSPSFDSLLQYLVPIPGKL